MVRVYQIYFVFGIVTF